LPTAGEPKLRLVEKRDRSAAIPGEAHSLRPSLMGNRAVPGPVANESPREHHRDRKKLRGGPQIRAIYYKSANAD
jgi:hypothetical protein